MVMGLGIHATPCLATNSDIQTQYIQTPVVSHATLYMQWLEARSVKVMMDAPPPCTVQLIGGTVPGLQPCSLSLAAFLLCALSHLRELQHAL